MARKQPAKKIMSSKFHPKLQLLHHGQHAYRKGRSTNTAVYQLIATIGGNLDCKESVIYLDIEVDLDHTSHGAFRRPLEEKEIGCTMVNCV